ncbi:MAG TPA: ester cyclase [Solirubrobacteraceae bacterium]|nr:ester cyclase [Solirubrobacteraceae bacterium]
MTSEDNKAIVRRIIDEAWNRGELATVDELFAPDYVEYNPRPGQEPGIEGYKGGILMLRAAFPDLRLELHEILAEGDRTAVRYTLHGTQEGELMGLPASGQRVASDGMVFARFEDGKVVERWGVQDMLTLLQQIGAFPAPAAATG